MKRVSLRGRIQNLEAQLPPIVEPEQAMSLEETAEMLYKAYTENREKGLARGWLDYNAGGELRTTERLHSEASYHEVGAIILATALPAILRDSGIMDQGEVKAGLDQWAGGEG